MLRRERTMQNRAQNKPAKRAGRILALVMALTLALSGAVMPQEAYAAAKKSKYKYKITVHNINSNTVLKKGQKIKISYTATKTKGGYVSGTKVKFKSSKKKVASVSKKGVIKAKKKGTTYITVYCKSKPSKKKKIKVRVGTPVSSISISGTRYLRVGRSNTLKAKTNSKATNKKVTWRSDNTAVATVNSDGKVKAKAAGECTIYAFAKDGSGVYGTRKVYVHQYYANETHWIAHRGLHTDEVENTAAAFEAAGRAGGFWGCECDIWETEKVPQSMPDLPGLPDITPDDPTPDPDAGQGDGQGGAPAPEEDPLPDVTDLKATIAAWPAADSMEIVGSANRQAVKDAWTEYNSLISGLDEEQIKELHLQMLADPENRSGEDYLAKLFNAYRWVGEYESIDLAINHDSTFKSVWGDSSTVKKMTASEIKMKLPGVCFLGTYLDICSRYNMVPVIEFKDTDMSPEAVSRALDMVEQYGMLDSAYYISFYSGTLQEVKNQATARLRAQGISSDPYTYYLISSDGTSKVTKAAQKHFTGVSLSKSIIDSGLCTLAKGYGLKIGTWTYRDQVSDDELLYKHLFTEGFGLEFATVDYKIFK